MQSHFIVIVLYEYIYCLSLISSMISWPWRVISISLSVFVLFSSFFVFYVCVFVCFCFLPHPLVTGNILVKKILIRFLLSQIYLTSSLCCEWIRFGQWLVCLWRGRDWQLYSCDHRWWFSLSYGTKSVASFAGMYGFSLTLDSPSVNDLTCVSVLLLLWYEASALNSIGFWVKLGFSFR